MLSRDERKMSLPERWLQSHPLPTTQSHKGRNGSTCRHAAALSLGGSNGAIITDFYHESSNIPNALLYSPAGPEVAFDPRSDLLCLLATLGECNYHLIGELD